VRRPRYEVGVTGYDPSASSDLSIFLLVAVLLSTCFISTPTSTTTTMEWEGDI